MAKTVARIRAVEVGFVLAILAVVGRAGQLQLVQGRSWAGKAVEKRTERDSVPARRGELMDRHGTPLALTQEFYHLGMAPREVTERAALVRAAARALEIPASRLDRELRSGKPYVYYHGPFTAQQVESLRAFQGVHLEPEYARFYPALSLARPIIGGLRSDGRHGASGLELALDTLLAGASGEQILLKDQAGRTYESPSRVLKEPVPGYDVVLTLDNELQEIAETGLEESIRATQAAGGDVVFYDPRNGELLAVASRQVAPNGELTARPTAFTDPFEPGSTAKLFTAAALLQLQKVSPGDAVSGENGTWLMPVSSHDSIRINDAHKSPGDLTLAQAVEVSSNIAMAKFSLRLSPGEQYDVLRDFGFGSPTGVEFPSESRGSLNRPDKWIAMVSRASIARGYEFGVTAVQLAAAYGAIANNGILLSPTLVREVRTIGGSVVYQRRPEPVRRAVSPEVAAKLREFLSGAVGEGGTGERAQLANYTLIGKTGTAFHFENGAYVRGEYTASFAALFPSEDPQLVVIVKIDKPQGDYYGGSTAAPLTRSMLQQALAARSVAIDRSRLAVREETAAAPGAVPEAEATRSVVTMPWPYRPDSLTPGHRQEVPQVVGLPVRRAVTALHRRGFKIVLHGLGQVSSVTPGQGDSVPVGGTVVLWAQ
ncbi:MAG: penicillin-binding transpeptidase domain-containing protein [Gemmatimonadota bacterium]